VDVMKETKLTIHSAVEHLATLRAVFARMKQDETARDRKLLQRTFDPFVNRPLFGNSPVRKVVFLEPDKSLELLSNIIAEVDWTLCDFILQGTSLTGIRRILDRLSKLSINILSRSLMVLNLYFDEKLLGQFSLLDLIVQHMQDMAGVPTDIFDTKHGQIFLNRLAKPVYDTLKLRLLNRNRQRAYMEAVIIQDWAQLQQEAHIVDVHYRKEKGLDNKSPPYISHYVLGNLVELMDLHVTIGVELSLYQSQEDLAIVYWYRDFLLSTLLNNMTAMRRTKEAAAILNEHHNIDSTSSSKSGKGKKKGSVKKEKNGNAQQKGKSDAEADFEFMAIECKRGLCRGLVRVRTEVGAFL
jgi:N-alpha-acetyltransferase 35, NatC auxiliary subunit